MTDEHKTRTTQERPEIESYLQKEVIKIRPFTAWEKVGDGIYLVMADDNIIVGKNLTSELLSRGYAVESCHRTNMRIRRIGLENGGLDFD